MPRALILGMAVFAILLMQSPGDAGKDSGIRIDKDKRTISIDARMAPRKLPHLKEIYPLEVIACWPHPKGQKAHETVVTIEARPSEVHKALESLGLKPGKVVMGGMDEAPQGPEVKVYLEVPREDGAWRRLTMDKVMIDSKNGLGFPKSVQFRFTGSAKVRPDPTRNDEIYGADESGTLISIFPVTDKTVMQTSLSMKYEKNLKLEINAKVLPKEGTAVRLVLEVAKK